MSKLKAFFETGAWETVKLILLLLFVVGMSGYIYLSQKDGESPSTSYESLQRPAADTLEEPIDPEYWR